ncbi:MAG: hypothetical protein AVDCRST_MAG95-1025 [uncultured Adhaeribacter sp.]|uniref:Uncharacterized protein n=1 Tax=uncultured Adhaeribacter sp. TaxID=448109 RepID=A0A6J4HRS2_9BACT|nr:MAG: hypothetical protein AVDCRST_MAG95-1025 [uncultured Adhaeribacter sp.]
MNPAEAITHLGAKTSKIPVGISYKIIEHFSAGLYTSPNKAIEELVANSYDALANRVDVHIPDIIEKDSIIYVVDNRAYYDKLPKQV